MIEIQEFQLENYGIWRQSNQICSDRKPFPRRSWLVKRQNTISPIGLQKFRQKQKLSPHAHSHPSVGSVILVTSNMNS